MTRRTFLASALAPLSLPSAENIPDCCIALDLSGVLQAANWPTAANAVSVGSLLKPFLALAYLATHARAPIVECLGAKAGCWAPRGHGCQDLVAALANSCNVYFLQLAAGLNRAALDLICLAHGLAPPQRALPAAHLIGLEEGWPQEPNEVGRAFATLALDAHQPANRLVLEGMARCSQAGTAQGTGFPCYAKTGTARCSHGNSGSGDGYAVAIFPLFQPRYVVLVMRHNTTGATAAYTIKSAIAGAALALP